MRVTGETLAQYVKRNSPRIVSLEEIIGEFAIKSTDSTSARQRVQSGLLGVINRGDHQELAKIDATHWQWADGGSETSLTVAAMARDKAEAYLTQRREALPDYRPGQIIQFEVIGPHSSGALVGEISGGALRYLSDKPPGRRSGDQ